MRRDIAASALALALLIAAGACREQGGSASGGVDTVRDRDTLTDTLRDTVRDTIRDTLRDTLP